MHSARHNITKSQTFCVFPTSSTIFFGCFTTLGITTVQIETLGAKFQILGPRCAPHYFSGPSQPPWARKTNSRSSHPRSNEIHWVFRYSGDRYGANGNSGREISNSGPEMYTPLLRRPEMCTPLFLRPESKPAGREEPIRVAPIRVVTQYLTFSCLNWIIQKNGSIFTVPLHGRPPLWESANVSHKRVFALLTPEIRS